ncbi:hypothetical protein ACQVRX_11160 [Ralstonia pseudosolanacearum]
MTTIVAVVGAYFLPKLIPNGLLEQLLKFSAVGIGVIWTLSYQVFTKLTDITETPGIDYRQHERLEDIVQVRVRRFWFGSILLFLCAIALTVPSLLTASSLQIPSAVWPFGILALGCCAVLLGRTIHLSEELRAFRSAVKESERREKERATQLAELKKAADQSTWEKDPQLSGFRGE